MRPRRRGLRGAASAPEDQVDQIVEHYPESCRGCGHHFSEGELSPAGRSERWQVADLPPIAVVVSEHGTHRLRCPACRVKTTAELPSGIASAFG